MGEAQAAPVGAVDDLLHAGNGPPGEKGDQPVTIEGRPVREAKDRPDRWLAGRSRRRAPARSRPGVMANTSWTVALNCRTLWNPEAKATSAIDTSVVSNRILAVWARWARASASGPAPATATNSR